MIRRMQRKGAEERKENNRAAIKAAADSELREDEVDQEELERTRRRQAGVQVTVESFYAWKIKFDEEMAAKSSSTAESTESLQKMSGKQWFLAQQASGEEVTEEELICAAELEFPSDEQLQNGLLQVLGDIDEDDDEEDDSDYVYEEDEDTES